MPRTANIAFRTTAYEARALRLLAASEGLSLSEWLRRHVTVALQNANAAPAEGGVARPTGAAASDDAP